MSNKPAENSNDPVNRIAGTCCLQWYFNGYLK